MKTLSIACRSRIIPVMFLSFLCVASGTSRAQWRPLFNGKDLSQWTILGGRAKFEVKDGVITGTSVPNTGNTFLVTKKTYGDFVLEMEIRLEDTLMNSGIQTRSHADMTANQGLGRVYGSQVEADPTARRWSGGINDEARRGFIYPLTYNPSARQAFRSGEYNRFRVECSGNVTRTWVNGVPVACVVDDEDSSGFIGLQVHAITGHPELTGKRTWFRNIRLQEGKFTAQPFPASIYIVNVSGNKLSAPEKAQGYRLLFNGKDGSGWRSARTSTFPTTGWEIAGGELRVLPSTGGESTNGGDIITTDEYAAFDLSFQYKLTPGANSGLKYFVTLQEKTSGSAIGLEYQVLDDTLHPDAKLGRDGNRTLASLYDLIRADKTPYYLRRIGAWNLGRVVVYPDNRVEHWINGQKVLTYVRGSKEFRDLVAISKYKDFAGFGEAKKGHILLQDHGNAVSFKSIRLRKL